MLKKLLCFIAIFSVINLPAIAAPDKQDEYQESIGEFQGFTDNREALYLRKVYTDKQHTGTTGFRYYVISHNFVRMREGYTQYCANRRKRNWAVLDGKKEILIQATSLASKNLLNSVCNFPQGT